MADKTIKLKELIQNNPNLSGNKIYIKSQELGLGIRKSDFYKLIREVRSLPEPSKEKIEKSIPKKFVKKSIVVVKKDVKPKEVKKKKIPFEKTKFGKIVKTMQRKHGISEKRAIERSRDLLRIPKRDRRKLSKVDQNVLIQYKT